MQIHGLFKFIKPATELLLLVVEQETVMPCTVFLNCLASKLTFLSPQHLFFCYKSSYMLYSRRYKTQVSLSTFLLFVILLKVLEKTPQTKFEVNNRVQLKGKRSNQPSNSYQQSTTCLTLI